MRVIEQDRQQDQQQEVTTLVASASAQYYPWLIKKKKYSIVIHGDLRQAGAPFRLWGERCVKPATAAVFLCKKCQKHSVMLLCNVKAGAETCYTCARTIHGMARNGNCRTYKLWQHLLTRYRANEVVEFAWLHPVTGVTAFVADVGECPGDDHYLCRRTEAGFWVRGNVYWRKALPGVWQSTSDDGWRLHSGHLHQIGATMKLSGKPAVYHCGVCDRHVIESRAGIIKSKHDRCTHCREIAASIEWRGKRQSVVEWAADTGIPVSVLHDRMRYGWDVERMLTTPPKPYRGRHSQISADSTQEAEKQAEKAP
jgi:hypothetical protein